MELNDFDILLHDVEVKLKRLRALYEQWFQGIERTEPHVPRKDLDRLFVLLGKEKPRNTAARFRLAQLKASYGLYQTYWQRIARQIEEGTYARDLRKVRARGMPSQRPPPVEIELSIDEEEAAQDDFAAVLRDMEARPSEAAPAPRPALSAFSPFAIKPGAKGAPPKGEPSTADRKPAAATFAKPKASAPPQPEPAKPAPAPPIAKAADPEPMPPSNPLPVISTLPPPRAIGVPPKPPPRGRPAPPPPPEPATKPAVSVPRPGGAVVPKPAAPPARPAVAAARPAPPAPREPDDRSLRKLFDDYLDARRRNNENVDHVRYEVVAESVKKMVPKLREKHGDKKIEFEVVVQNGRVGFKPKIE